MEGRQYWPNACAHAVNDCFKHLGIDLVPHTRGNPNWVPNYAHVGHPIEKLSELQPGDLVIYQSSHGGFDHIGIYAGDGQAWNVASSHSHRWTRTAIGHNFQMGRRFATS
jgi:cell wall-associated NlpC family hydrolase